MHIGDVAHLDPFRVRLRTRFRGVEERAGVLVRGPAGWGEFSPFPDYGPAYASRWLAAALEAAVEPFPLPARHRIPVNVTVPAVGPDAAHDLVARSGCATAKVKVGEPGQDLAADVERVAAVRAALGPTGAIRVDANGAWDLQTAALAVRRLAAAAGGLEYVEQPCRTVDELRQLRRRIEVAIAADESVRTAEDPLEVARKRAADVLVVKVQPLGGVRRALEIVTGARLPAVVSSAVETSVGLAAGVALAASLPELPYACGLGTGTLLADDVTLHPLIPEDGHLPVRRVEPDAALLDQVAPPPELGVELLGRLEAATEHLMTEAG